MWTLSRLYPGIDNTKAFQAIVWKLPNVNSEMKKKILDNIISEPLKKVE